METAYNPNLLCHLTLIEPSLTIFLLYLRTKFFSFLLSFFLSGELMLIRERLDERQTVATIQQLNIKPRKLKKIPKKIITLYFCSNVNIDLTRLVFGTV